MCLLLFFHATITRTSLVAAVRETLEEAGVEIVLKGILAIEHQPCEGGLYLRLRIIFYAEPKESNALPKSMPDIESVGAAWCSFDEITTMKEKKRLRSKEPYIWAKYITNGGKWHPLSLLKEI